MELRRRSEDEHLERPIHGLRRRLLDRLDRSAVEPAGAPGSTSTTSAAPRSRRGIRGDGLPPTSTCSAASARRARFDSGTFSGGVDVSDSKIPNTPAFDDRRRPVREVKGEHHSERLTQHDRRVRIRQRRTQRRAATNLRGGMRHDKFYVDSNAFDTRCRWRLPIPASRRQDSSASLPPAHEGINVGIGSALAFADHPALIPAVLRNNCPSTPRSYEAELRARRLSDRRQDLKLRAGPVDGRDTVRLPVT